MLHDGHGAEESAMTVVVMMMVTTMLAMTDDHSVRLQSGLTIRVTAMKTTEDHGDDEDG